MSLSGILIIAATLLIAAGMRESARSRAERGPFYLARARHNTGLPGWMARLPQLGKEAAELRLARAGFSFDVDLRTLVLARLIGASVCLAVVLAFGLMLPFRLLVVLLPCGAVIGLGLPDLLIEMAAARRRRQILSELPDAIDVLAVATAGGRSVRSAIADIAHGGRGPLARELSIAVSEVEAGRSAVQALSSLRRRVPLVEVGALVRAIERSSRLGSPLVEELNRQAGSLRDDQRRNTAERAARAAPKIQLVIALILVPSVLLLIAAYLAANAGRFFPGF